MYDPLKLTAHIQLAPSLRIHDVTPVPFSILSGREHTLITNCCCNTECRNWLRNNPEERVSHTASHVALLRSTIKRIHTEFWWWKPSVKILNERLNEDKNVMKMTVRWMLRGWEVGRSVLEFCTLVDLMVWMLETMVLLAQCYLDSWLLRDTKCLSQLILWNSVFLSARVRTFQRATGDFRQ